jgi:hypothetical protein
MRIAKTAGELRVGRPPTYLEYPNDDYRLGSSGKPDAVIPVRAHKTELAPNNCPNDGYHHEGRGDGGTERDGNRHHRTGRFGSVSQRRQSLLDLEKQTAKN